MNSCELVTYISSLACAISKCCSRDDVTILAAVFTQLGDSLETILAHQEICQPKDEPSTDFKYMD